MCQSRGYPITGVQLQKVVKPVIGHPHDCVPIGVRRTDHHREFRYTYDYKHNL